MPRMPPRAWFTQEERAVCRDSCVDTLAGLRIAAGGSGCGCGWGWRPWRGKVPDGSQTPQPLVFGGGRSSGEAFSGYVHQPQTGGVGSPAAHCSGTRRAAGHHTGPERPQELGDPRRKAPSGTQGPQPQSRAPETEGHI